MLNVRSSNTQSHSTANKHAEIGCADRDLVGCSNTQNDSSADQFANNGDQVDVECADRDLVRYSNSENDSGGDEYAIRNQPLSAFSEKSPFMHSEYEKELSADQIFNNAEDFRLALYKYSLAKRFKYRFSRNASKRLKVKCLADKCPWELTAFSIGDNGLIRVHTFIEEHDHEGLDEYYSQPLYKSKWVTKLVKDKVKGSPDRLSTKRCNELLGDLPFTVGSRQTFRLRERLKLAINGKKEHTYKLVPWMCQHLMSVMPGTVASWSQTEENQFKQLFVAYHCSMSGFQHGCRPLLFIDEFVLQEDCIGSLLSITALDANDEMFPVAYGVDASAGDVDWTWFVEKLKLIVGEREVVIISNGNQSFLDKLSDLFGLAMHSFCFRQLHQNFNSYLTKLHLGARSNSKKAALDLLKTIAFARLDPDYNNALTTMKLLGKDMYEWVLASGPEHWANSQFKGKRWDKLNSDDTDGFYSWLSNECQDPILEFMKAHVCKMADLIHSRQRDLLDWTGPVGNKIEMKIQQNMNKSQSLLVTQVSDFVFDFEVQRSMIKVDLRGMVCSCLEWQMTGIPCAHACKALQWANLDVYQFVEKYYYKEMQEIIYEETVPDFSGLDINTSCCDLNPKYDVPFDLKPPEVKRSPGRPKGAQTFKRSATCSDCDEGGQDHGSSKPQRKAFTCSLCNEIGHNQRTCKKSKSNTA